MKQFLKNIKKDKGLLFLALPGTLWYLIFCYLPLFGVMVAFKQYRIFDGGFLGSLMKSPWVGFKNFEFLFASTDTLIVLRNTIAYNIVFIALGIIIPVFISICIKEVWSDKGKKLYQSILFFPYFLSWVVVSYFVLAFLDPTKGLVNKFLESRGGEFINFYLEPSYWPSLLIGLNTWKGLGYGTVLYLATLVGINRTYYEAAMIDGASTWQRTRYITLPFLKPVVTVLLLLSISKILNSDFGLFYQVPKNSGALFNVTQTLDTYVYRALTHFGNIGMSSAAALFQSVIGFVLVLLSNYSIKKIDKDSGLF